MSTMAQKLAAALEPLSPATKAALAKLLRKQLPAAPKAAALLLDTRIDAELWLAGEDTSERNRALRRAPKGLYRRIVVTLADGFSVTTGSHLIDDGAAKAAAVRYARARAMESVFAATDPGATVAQRMVEAYRNRGNGWQWVTLPDASQRRTRACAVAPVATVEIVPLPAPAVEPVPAVEPEPEYFSEYFAVDSDALARRAERMENAIAAFSAEPTPEADASRTASEALGRAPAPAGPVTSEKPGKRAQRAQAATVVPIRRASRSAYAVHNAAGFVLFVGPRRSAYAFSRAGASVARPLLSVSRLPAGWRTAANPSRMVANAQAKVAGERQRVRVTLAAA
jgi:hypothetical protein